MVTRKVKNGAVVILGRRYYVPEFQRRDLEGTSLRVDDDGVVRSDLPKWGVHTASSVRAFVRYTYVATLHLDKKIADALTRTCN